MLFDQLLTSIKQMPAAYGSAAEMPDSEMIRIIFDDPGGLSPEELQVGEKLKLDPQGNTLNEEEDDIWEKLLLKLSNEPDEAPAMDERSSSNEKPHAR